VRLLLEKGYGEALGVFAIAGITDAVDGFIAKRWNRRTRLGEILDPIADKLLVVSAVLILTRQGRIPLWLGGAIVGRDVTIVAGALALRAVAGKLEMAPSLLSKLNTSVQLSMILLVLVHGARVAKLDGWLSALFFLALFTTAISGVHYVVVWGGRIVELYRRPET
jgi:cardiolipin synthase